MAVVAEIGTTLTPEHSVSIGVYSMSIGLRDLKMCGDKKQCEGIILVVSKPDQVVIPSRSDLFLDLSPFSCPDL